MVTRFQLLNEDIARVTRLIDEDSSHLLGEAPNLLLIHHDLFHLEEFKDRTLRSVESEGPAVVQVVTKYFRRLDQVSDTFRQYIWALARNMIPLVRENQGSVIVRLLKIIEVEERFDELAQESDHSGGAVRARTPKNYRSEFFSVLHESIAKYFAEKFATIMDVTETLQSANFIFEDLTIVFEELVPRFPEKYKIFPFYALQYHKHVYDLLNRIVGQKLETREILLVTSWVRDYYRTMGDKLGVTEELLEPRLLDDKETSLISEYVKLVQEKLTEWVDRLQQTEEAEFRERDKPPDAEADGFYVTSSAVILFQMINQQIDVAIETRDSRLLFDVLRECFAVMAYFQQKQNKMLESEMARYNLKNEDVALGLPEYIIAVCNNHLKCTEFLETLQQRVEPFLGDSYKENLETSVGDAREGFSKLSKRGITYLVDIVMRDLQPAVVMIFTNAWYDQRPMGAVIATLQDYFTDFKTTLQDYLFTKLVTECLDRFLIAYLEAFRSKQAKFKMPDALQFAKEDLEACITFWSEYRPAKRVKQSFDIFEKILGLLEASASLIFLSWYSLWKAYKDVPMAFVEDLLSKRSDLDRSAVKEAMTSCKAKASEGPSEGESSIFSKLQQ